MPLTPEQEALAAPYLDVATDLVAMLKEDRALAISFAKHHGLIPGDYAEEPRSATAEWLRKILAASPRCPHCGGELYEEQDNGR